MTEYLNLRDAKSVAQAFEVYRTGVIPPEAGRTQVLETKRSFYAAVHWMLLRVLDISNEVVTEEEGQHWLHAVINEMKEWIEETNREAEEKETHAS
jgi:hypothetical protein